MISQVDVYELRIRSFTTIYDPVYDRIHAIYAPYTTVFFRITWLSITIVCRRDRIRRNTEVVYGGYTIVNDRIVTVYGRIRSFFIVISVGYWENCTLDYFSFCIKRKAIELISWQKVRAFIHKLWLFTGKSEPKKRYMKNVHEKSFITKVQKEM